LFSEVNNKFVYTNLVLTMVFRYNLLSNNLHCYVIAALDAPEFVRLKYGLLRNHPYFKLQERKTRSLEQRYVTHVTPRHVPLALGEAGLRVK
jgi:hypothetical protein